MSEVFSIRRLISALSASLLVSCKACPCLQLEQISALLVHSLHLIWMVNNCPGHSLLCAFHLKIEVGYYSFLLCWTRNWKPRDLELCVSESGRTLTSQWRLTPVHQGLVFRTRSLGCLMDHVQVCISASQQPWWSYLPTTASVPHLSAHFKKAEKVAYLARCSSSWMLRVGLLWGKNWQHSALGGQKDLSRLHRRWFNLWRLQWPLQSWEVPPPSQWLHLC